MRTAAVYAQRGHVVIYCRLGDTHRTPAIRPSPRPDVASATPDEPSPPVMLVSPTSAKRHQRQHHTGHAVVASNHQSLRAGCARMELSAPRLAAQAARRGFEAAVAVHDAVKRLPVFIAVGSLFAMVTRYHRALVAEPGHLPHRAASTRKQEAEGSRLRGGSVRSSATRPPHGLSPASALSDACKGYRSHHSRSGALREPRRTAPASRNVVFHQEPGSIVVCRCSSLLSNSVSENISDRRARWREDQRMIDEHAGLSKLPQVPSATTGVVMRPEPANPTASTARQTRTARSQRRHGVYSLPMLFGDGIPHLQLTEQAFYLHHHCIFDDGVLVSPSSEQHRPTTRRLAIQYLQRSSSFLTFLPSA